MSPQFAADVLFECYGSAGGARSSGRQRGGPRHASQCCTVSSLPFLQ